MLICRAGDADCWSVTSGRWRVPFRRLAPRDLFSLILRQSKANPVPIKVCILTSAHPVFDVRIFHKECKTLARAGYDVTLVAGHSESLRVDGVTIKAVTPAKGRFERWFKTTAAVYRAAVAVDADIYHFHDPELIPTGLLLRARGKKVIYDMHEDLPATVPYKPYVPKWLQPALARVLGIGESLAVRRFSGLIAASPEISARYVAHPNLSVVQNYPLREEFPEDSKTSSRGDYVVYVGLRITRARGAVEMVRAIELVPEALQVRLKLVGTIEPGDLVEQLQAMPGWGLTEYVGPLGRVGVDAKRDGRARGSASRTQLCKFAPGEAVRIYVRGHSRDCVGLSGVSPDHRAGSVRDSCRLAFAKEDCGGD
jgi:hypothetical protein